MDALMNVHFPSFQNAVPKSCQNDGEIDPTSAYFGPNQPKA